ncbi:MAG TPA: hypothetical protein VLF40_05080 [Candidatus Saccharimonadales bacterium]|nr:hypothetical protein [Candidatus Saccharimonadales bacterium]
MNEHTRHIALGVIDVQPGFMPAEEGLRLGLPGFGELPVPGGQEIVPKMNRLMAAFAAAGHPIFTTQDFHPRETAHFSETPDYETTWPVHCVGGGCTGDLNLIPNFASINGALIEHNLFGASQDGSYCTYGGEKSTSSTPHSYNVVYKDNIFQRGANNQCATYGPVTGFEISNSGNQWTNNKWDDGGTVNPEN